MLKIHEAEMTQENSKGSGEENEVMSESDEEAHMKQQRITTKVFSQISQFNSHMPDDLSSSRGRGSAVLGSGSSYSSSIDERKSKGQYFVFPRNKTKQLEKTKTNNQFSRKMQPTSQRKQRKRKRKLNKILEMSEAKFKTCGYGSNLIFWIWNNSLSLSLTMVRA